MLQPHAASIGLARAAAQACCPHFVPNLFPPCFVSVSPPLCPSRAVLSPRDALQGSLPCPFLLHPDARPTPETAPPAHLARLFPAAGMSSYPPAPATHHSGPGAAYPGPPGAGGQRGDAAHADGGTAGGDAGYTDTGDGDKYEYDDDRNGDKYEYKGDGNGYDGGDGDGGYGEDRGRGASPERRFDREEERPSRERSRSPAR